MADEYAEKPRVISENNPLPTASLNPAGLVVLAVLIALIPGLFVYLYIHAKETNITKKPQKQIISYARNAQKPTPTLRISKQTVKPTPPVTPQPQLTTTLSDITYTAPEGWEAVKVFGDETAYQIAFRPKGGGDSPIVLNVYKNTKNSFDSFMNAQIDGSDVKEKQESKGKNGIYIKQAGDESYFLNLGSAYIQIAAVLNDAQNHSYFNAIYSSIQAKR